MPQKKTTRPKKEEFRVSGEDVVKKVKKLIEVLGEVKYVKQEMNKKLLFDIGLKFIQTKDEDLYLIDKIITACASSGTKLDMVYKIKKNEDKKN